MSTNAFGTPDGETSRYVCLNGCGFAATDRREFERHRRRNGHRDHGMKLSKWP